MRHARGFTLIELSIVLVIIGLLVGGLLTGRDLIFAANMRKQMAIVEEVKAGIAAFRLKYNCIPGDCATTTSLGLSPPAEIFDEVLIGNGDGVIGDNSGYRESGLFIWNLRIAGFVPYRLNTDDIVSGDDPVEQIYITAPLSYTGDPQGYAYIDRSDPTMQQSIMQWWTTPLSTSGGYWEATSPGENGDVGKLYILDRKYDDANGHSGRIKIHNWELDFNQPDACVSATGVYNIEGTTLYCPLLIDLPY